MISSVPTIDNSLVPVSVLFWFPFCAIILNRILLEKDKVVFIWLHYLGTSIIEGSQGRNMKRATGNKIWSEGIRGILTGLLFMACSAYYFPATQDSVPMSGKIYSGLCPPTIIINLTIFKCFTFLIAGNVMKTCKASSF